jgi:hypothetical protein
MLRGALAPSGLIREGKENEKIKSGKRPKKFREQ